MIKNNKGGEAGASLPLSLQSLLQGASGAVRDVLLPSVANAFRRVVRLQYFNHDRPTSFLLLLFLLGAVKDLRTTREC